MPLWLATRPQGEEPLPPAVAAALNQIAWWDKPDHEVKALVPLLMSGDLRGFFAHAGHALPQSLVCWNMRGNG
jgi:hypothetical protein